MNKSLTEQEIQLIKESIEFYDGYRKKIPILTLIAITVMILLMLNFKNSIETITLTTILVIAVSFYIWFRIFGKPANNLKKDIKQGIKIVQPTKIQKLKTTKGETSYVLDNGIAITEVDFNDESLELNSLKIGQTLIIDYTPYQKMVMSVKINNEFST